MRYLLLIFLAFSTLASDCRLDVGNSKVYNSNKLVVVAGSIRQNFYEPSKWCWINDSNHTPIGVNPNLCHKAINGKIVINYGIKYKKVVSFMVGADETYTTKLNMGVGVSAGLELSIIEITINGHKESPEYNLGYRNGNIWIYGLMERF